MEKTIRQEMKVTWVLKALMAAYVVTSFFFVADLYTRWSSVRKVTARDYMIYVLSTFGRTCDREAFQNEKIFVGTCGRNFIFRVIAFDFLWDLSYLQKWGRIFDVVPVSKKCWNGRWNDFLKNLSLNLTCM